ncbi:hypothetical protein [Porphyromonas gulae]|uniref:hypothetical protein n=1 Tax=Porphyromonas gulae TaxID=111105 RepID=UPI00052C3EB7|nr:hypothetical protein [Porphyromonas gulae]KGN89303.1 hypothetical protein HQ46_05400 [Porphyromonas gulae]KKC50795.1 hypothetical protein HR10_07060 [Porphyromonas gulae]
MRKTGIALIVIGAISALGHILAITKGHEPRGLGGALAFVVLGAFLISRDKKKKEEAEAKKQWEEGNSDSNE